MGAQVGSEGEIGIQGRRPDLLLEPGQVRRFIANQGEECLSRPVTPGRELGSIYSVDKAVSKPLATGRSGVGSLTVIQVPEAGIRLIFFFCALTHISQYELDRAGPRYDCNSSTDSRGDRLSSSLEEAAGMA
jgi:hypothetical protein